MRFKSADDLKTEILNTVAPAGGAQRDVSIAIGIAPTATPGEYRIAVRMLEQNEGTTRAIQEIAARSSGEIDIRITGDFNTELRLPAGIAHEPRVLTLGSSVAHFRCSAGSLGFFARRVSDQSLGFVSCNHVIAAHDTASGGDDVLFPGPADGGTRSRNVIAHVDGAYVRLKSEHPMDCAFAYLDTSLAYEPFSVTTGRFLSSEIAAPTESQVVEKIGRTTGRTRGRITAFDLENLRIAHPVGPVIFKNQIEITSDEASTFCRPGDSGALVYTLDSRPVALLHGSTARGMAYAQPLEHVIAALGVELVV